MTLNQTDEKPPDSGLVPGEDSVVWSHEVEVCLFHAMIGHKPVGKKQLTLLALSILAVSILVFSMLAVSSAQSKPLWIKLRVRGSLKSPKSLLQVPEDYH